MKNIFISPDISHPYIKKISEYLDITLEKDIDKVKSSDKPVIIWNPHAYVKNPRVQRKKDLYDKCVNEKRLCYIVERGALPNTIMIDKNGFLNDSTSYDETLWNKPLSKKKMKKVEKYIDDIKKNENSLEPQSSRVSKDVFLNKIGSTVVRKKVFVPLQVHNDTVILLWAGWSKNLKNFMSIIKDMADSNPDIDFVVKNHPIETSFKHNLMRVSSPNIKIADDIHYKDCIEYCDVVVTVNSGVGLQAMMWNKPVIICGDAFYQNKKINTKAKNMVHLDKCINHPKKPNFKCVKKFIYYLKYEFYCDCTMRKIRKDTSELTSVKQLIYYNKSNKMKKITEKKNRLFLKIKDLINSLKEIDFHLLESSCYDAVYFGELQLVKNIIHIGTPEIEKLEELLISNCFKKTGNTYSNEHIKVICYESDLPTKTKLLYDHEVKVPLPVIPYLKKCFGDKYERY
jgi:capsule polysaccharide export protein KpsC/LpsZ